MSKTASPTRLGRILSILVFVDRNPGVSITKVAKHFGCTVSTIEDDLHILMDASAGDPFPGAGIEFEADLHAEENRLELTNTCGIARPLRFTPIEAKAIAAGCFVLAQTLDDEAARVAKRTAAKVITLSGTEEADFSVALVETSNSVAPEILQLIRQSLASGYGVTLRYSSGRDEVSERDVEPLQLISRFGHWYLKAWCHRSQAERTFRLDRILEINTNSLEITSLAKTGRDRRRRRTVWLTVDTKVLGHVEEIAQEVVSAGNGLVKAKLGVFDDDWLRRHINALAPYIHLVEPASAAHLAAKWACEALAHYGR